MVGAAFAADQVPRVSANSPLTPEQVLPIMQKALGEVEADIEIVEISHFPVPAGEIEFHLADLTTPFSAESVARWRGFVRQDGGQTFSIWARVRISADRQRVVATERLEVGQPILPSQVREESYRAFPFAKDATWTLADVVGRSPLRAFREGMPVPPSATAEPVVVPGGAEVLVEYRSGGLRITLPGVALGAGRQGDTISVRNASSKKIFEARVEGPGRVVVESVQ